MNIIENTLNALVSGAANERVMRDKIVEYLYRVEIVSDSIALLLLQEAIDALQKHVEQSHLKTIERDSKLNTILQHMQTSIVKLEIKSSYLNVTRKKIEQTSSSTKTASKKKVSNLIKNRQIRKFTVNVIDVMKKKIVKIMFTKDIMIKLQKKTKSSRDVTQLINDSIKIQAESKEARKILQDKIEIVKKFVNSTTIRIRIYVVRVNDIRVNHINVNN
jgi:hypothetical protein